MRLRNLAVFLAMTMVAPIASTADAAEPSTASAIQARGEAAGGYLGVLLGPVPDAIRAQLGQALPTGQGVLVEDVMEGSPAAKAGLKDYDVLIDYGDQRLFSAEQLSRLVRGDGPDKAISLRFVRGGVVKVASVTLGQTRTAAGAECPAVTIPNMPKRQHQIQPFAPPFNRGTVDWDGFDSITIKKQEDGNFKAEIQYLDENGKLIRHTFTGTRDAIREQIMRHLPPAARNQLLDALGARDEFIPPSPDWIAPGFFMPPWPNRQPGF